MTCTQKYLDRGCFLKALHNLTKEMAYYLYKEQIFILKNTSKGDTVLDLGCGNGRAIFYLAKGVGFKGKVIGIDNNKSMMERASEDTKTFRNVKIYYLDAKKTFFPDNYFDVISITFNMFGNIKENERKAILEEAYRIIKPNGLILGTVYSEKAHLAQKEQYQKIGLRVDNVDKFYVYVNEVEFKGERFSRDRLKKILSVISSRVKIEKICDISYGFKVRVKKDL